MTRALCTSALLGALAMAVLCAAFGCAHAPAQAPRCDIPGRSLVRTERGVLCLEPGREIRGVAVLGAMAGTR